MNKTELTPIEQQIKSKYIFVNRSTDLNPVDTYFCTCGAIIKNMPSENFDLEIEMTEEEYLNMEFFDPSQYSRKVNITCPTCTKMYSRKDVWSNIYSIDHEFLEKFSVQYDQSYLTIRKTKFTPRIEDNMSDIWFDTKSTYFSIRKNDSETTIHYKGYEDELERNVDLNNVIKLINNFFKKQEQVEIVDDFVYIHDFIGKLGKYVIDVENINILNELLSEIRLSAGVEIIKKIFATFFGIILYPNLSTLALTKGPTFLNDLMVECPLPSAKEMKESGATSPLKIFNHLINLKNLDIQKDLDADDTSKLGYTFKLTEGKEITLKYDTFRLEQEKKVVKKANKIFVRDDIKNISISPFIFNKIEKFSDYGNLIKYLRFISYNQLIELCNKYDKNFLIKFYEVIEFREEMDFDRVIQFIHLIEDFCLTINVNKSDKIDINDIVKYDFNIYDDCQRMLIELDWDFEKVFFKIKKHSKLLSFHDDLIKHRGYLNNADINEKYIKFSAEFKHLEDYQGPIKIKLIDLPEDLVKKAKDMQNCAASYVRRVALGEYIAFLVYDNNPRRESKEIYEYMMVLELSKYGLEFVGVKGPCNVYGPDRFKKDVMTYLEEKNISFKEVPSIRLGVNNREEKN